LAEPNVTTDLENLMEWEHGDTLYGTFAKSHHAMKEYINDINRAWGKEDSYKDWYIDTFKKKVGIGEQLT